MPAKISLAKYLFTRLRQHGVDSVFGVPGDFTLKALDHLKASGLKWVGTCNELNAGYAADGYGRTRGLGALFTTYGVGELSAINAVAGSYAEQVPVVHIVGSPQTHLIHSGAKVHHTLGDGRSLVFAEMHKQVTVAAANLFHLETAPEMVDDAIQSALIHSLPAYIQLPCDMVSKEVSTERLSQNLLTELGTDTSRGQDVAKSIMQLLHNAKKPLLLVDRGDGIPTLKRELNELVSISHIPTLTMPSGGGMIDHSISNYFGVHSGPVGQIDTLPYVQSSDLVLAFGPMFSDTQTLGWKVVPDSNKMVIIGKNYVQMPSSKNKLQINVRSLIGRLACELKTNPLEIVTNTSLVASLGDFRRVQPPQISHLDEPVDQTTLYLRLQSYLKPADIVILGNATPILGGRDFILPPGATIIASGMWFSIGHMLPAALGAAMAQQEKNPNARTILFDGDGNFQVTAQELSTIIREKLNMTIFIINNSGYAYERQIHGMEEGYNDLAPWRYLEAPRFFGASSSAPRGTKDAHQGQTSKIGKTEREYSIDMMKIETWGDLEEFLQSESMNDGRGLKLVEVIIGKYDVPEKFRQVFQAAGEKL